MKKRNWRKSVGTKGLHLRASRFRKGTAQTAEGEDLTNGSEKRHDSSIRKQQGKKKI